MTDFPRTSEEDGARKLVTRAAIVACILLVAAWFAFPWFLGGKDQLAKPSTASDVHTPATNVGNAAPTQSEAASTAAKPAAGKPRSKFPRARKQQSKIPKARNMHPVAVPALPKRPLSRSI
jgi:hypothetical protein